MDSGRRRGTETGGRRGTARGGRKPEVVGRGEAGRGEGRKGVSEWCENQNGKRGEAGGEREREREECGVKKQNGEERTTKRGS